MLLLSIYVLLLCSFFLLPIYLICWGIKLKRKAEKRFFKAYEAAAADEKSLYLIKYAWGDLRVLPQHKDI